MRSVDPSIAGGLPGDPGMALGTGHAHTIPPNVLPPPAPTAVAQPPPPASADVGRARILIVDDDALVARSVRRALHGQDVTICHSAAEALAALQTGATFDVVLCDLMMPQMSGMDLHAQLQVTHPDVVERMVFMTGGAFTEQARRFLEDIPNVRLEKPVEAEVLRRTVLLQAGVPSLSAA